MPESYGVTETPLTQDKLLSGDHPRVELPVTVASGSGELSRGALLGRKTSDGKYAPITPGTTYEDEDIGTGTGSQTDFLDISLANPGVKPGSFTATAKINNDPVTYETFSDNGDGTLASDNGGTGKINYAEGKVVELKFGTAPLNEEDILATYVGELTAHTEDIETNSGSGETDWYKTLANTKVVEKTLRIYTNEGTPKVLHDDGHGHLVGADGSGSINYETGECDIHFAVSPTAGSTIKADYCSTDGTHICRAILGRDIDATSEDVNTITYVHGVFNPDGVGWPTGTSAIQKQEIARDCQERGIYFKFSL
ncbi:MAG: head decoration protein [candidate division WOR-3 bacterium]|nr:head decoration protein [candidate division WOR-3 bacterium]